ncbi:MAG: ATP-binding protein [Cyanobacteria bacterium J06597_1]
MNSAQLDRNADCIGREITWFNTVLEQRFKLHFDGDPSTEDLLHVLPPPDIQEIDAPYAEVVRTFELQPAERLLLILSFIPHLKPHLLDSFFIRNQSLDRGFTEFGGITGNSHGGFLPTCETAMFLLAGANLSARLRYDRIFRPDNILFTQGILHCDLQHPTEPLLSAALHLSPEYRERLITGQTYTPPFSSVFPAQRITTRLDWDNLVLDPTTQQEIDDILTWIQYQHVLMNEWQLNTCIKPGFRSLFYGPPGTGKTMTACLLGKKTGLPVFRIDLSKVVSKYIGDTEKNLARLFDRAQHQQWILLFDEAESLFGKRTESRNSNDRAANQEVSYLLQRIEDYSGLAILATNLRSHIDEAFARRFQSAIHFPMPTAEQRLQLWQESFTNKLFGIAEDVDFTQLAAEHELAGGGIVNVLRYASLKAIQRTPPIVYVDDLVHGIQRELKKEGRHMTNINRSYWSSTLAIHNPITTPSINSDPASKMGSSSTNTDELKN